MAKKRKRTTPAASAGFAAALGATPKQQERVTSPSPSFAAALGATPKQQRNVSTGPGRTSYEKNRATTVTQRGVTTKKTEGIGSGFDPVGMIEDEVENLVDVGVEKATHPLETAKDIASIYPSVAAARLLAGEDALPSEKELRVMSWALPVAGKGGVKIATTAAEAIAEKAAAGAAKKAAVKAGVWGAAKRAAAKAEPGAARGAREAVQGAAAKAGAKVPRGVKTAAGLGARTAAYPVRHPFKAPFVGVVPQAAATGDPAGALTDALEGKGAYAKLLSGLGGVPGEALSLPATVVPSIFLTGKAGVSAVKGDSEELDKLWEEYKKTGFIPGLIEGGPSEGLSRFEEHPLYSGLEIAGAKNVIGRGIGAAARSTPGVHWADLTERPTLPVHGSRVNVDRGRYSRDVFRQAIQKGYERTRPGQRVAAGSHRAGHYEKQAQSRFQSGARRYDQELMRGDLEVIDKLLPRHKGGITGLGVRSHIDWRTAEVLHLAVQRIAQKGSSFHADLEHHLAEVNRVSRDLKGPELKANRRVAKAMERALDVKDPKRIEATIEAANEFIDYQNKELLPKMIEHGFITPEQATRAALFPWARIHHGAEYGVPLEKRIQHPTLSPSEAASKAVQNYRDRGGKSADAEAAIEAKVSAHIKDQAEKAQRQAEGADAQLIDAAGNPLSTESIVASMRAKGIEPPGFITHRRPSRGEYYQPSYEGARLGGRPRTGKSIVEGTAAGGVEALVRTVARSRTLTQASEHYNRWISQHTFVDPRYGTFAKAQAVIHDPTLIGLPANSKLIAVPRRPFLARKNEIDAAMENQDPQIVTEKVERIAEGALKGENMDANTEIAFAPRKQANLYASDVKQTTSLGKFAQAGTNLFKRAVLPWSPGFYIGNAFDNFMRATLAGVNPLHWALGRKATKDMSRREQAELNPQALYGAAKSLAPKRKMDQMVEDKYGKASNVLKEAADWSHVHGPGQTAVKFAPEMVNKTSDWMLTKNHQITEELIGHGVLGKVLARELRETQGSWAKAIYHWKDAWKSFTKGEELSPEKIIRLQKSLEQVLGNYSNLSPSARRFLTTIAPFWTWTRSAYKFVYLTMPAHHTIQTGLITAASRANQATLEAYGLNPEGDEPLPNHLLGGIPLPNDRELPFSNYNSFGFAGGSPTREGGVQGKLQEVLSRSILPQAGGGVLFGIDYKGDPIDKENWMASWAFQLAGGFVPGWNIAVHKNPSGKVYFKFDPAIPEVKSKEYLSNARQQWETIDVPKKEGGSSGSSDSVFGGSGSSGGGVWGGSSGGSSGGVWGG